MKAYELTYIVSPEITAEEAEAKGKEIESLIQSKEGTILKQSNPIAKTFAHPIGKRASGFLGVIEFNIEADKLLEIKAAIEKDGKIVRHMIIIKLAAELKKERRTRVRPTPVFEIEKKAEVIESAKEEITEEKPAVKEKEKEKEKVELKDIEHELDEILG